MHTPIRVMMVLQEYHPLFSGHAIYLRSLIPHLQNLGCGVRILTSDHGTLSPTDTLDGVLIHRVRSRPGSPEPEVMSSARLGAALVRLRNDFDLVHVHGHVDTYGLLCAACKAMRKPIIMQMVLLGSDDPMSIRTAYRFMWLRMPLLRWMDRTIYISRAIGDSCRRAGYSPEKIVHIPQGVDTARFAPPSKEDRHALRVRCGIASDAVVVTFIGAIIERKGVDILIDAWTTVQEAHPGALLTLIGPCDFSRDDNENEITLNQYSSRVQRMAEERTLNVRFLGRMEDVSAYLKASDVFVLPSRKEGFGNVILEAMACGIPPVVAYMDGVSGETVTDGVTGFVFHSTAELAERLGLLISDSVLRGEVGRAARSAVLHDFPLDRIAAAYLQTYADALGTQS